MPNPQRKVIGIDFGSTQSSIAVMTIGTNLQPDLLNLGGGRNGFCIPTQLVLDANDSSIIAWGCEVSEQYRKAEDHDVKFASNFKRYFGAKHSADAPDDEKNAEKYAYLFLRKLAEFTQRHFNVTTLDSDDYVTCIGHPASWDEDRVRALRQCAKQAGFPVELDTGEIYSVKEPIAAMNALRVVDGLNFKYGNSPEHYLVIDFGGGTLDVCVVKTGILGASPSVLSTAGDPQLGGKDFDDIIEDLFFRSNSLIDRSRVPPRELAALRDKIREAKESFALSFQNGNRSATQAFNLPSGQYSLTVTKDELESICRAKGFIERIVRAISDALTKASIDKAHIRKVVLTGGSCKWWFVREVAAQEFTICGDNIYETQNPFTDVATGCAMDKGFSDRRPDKKGVWVRYALDDTAFSTRQLVFNPFRLSGALEEERVFLCRLDHSKLLTPYTLRLQFQAGFGEDQLDSDYDEAVVVLYACSNHPWRNRLSDAAKAISGKRFTQADDKYDVYLIAHEDRIGSIQYKLLVYDFARSEYERLRLTLNDKSQLNTVPKGHGVEVDVIPGKRATRGFFGLWNWRHETLATIGKRDSA